jgi:ribonuclease D
VRTLQFITDVAVLANVVNELRHVRRLGLDTEGNGMHAYRNRLCLVQFCVAHDEEPSESVWVVDALAIGSLAPLGELFGANGPELVIHDLAFDARMMAQAGLPIAGVIDTALHARYLGLKETGLGSLLANRFGLQLTKTHQQDDWARRPLDDEQLEYLSSDVAYLGPLAAGLVNEALTLGIAAEIGVETEYALSNALADTDETSEPSYVRIKGAGDLQPVSRAALRELAIVREKAAERYDMPVGRLVSNASLVALAKQRPRTVHEVRKAAGLYDRGASIAAELLDALQRAERAGDVPEDERALLTKPKLASGDFAVRRARENALTAWRRKVAAERTVDVQVVLPGHALNDIVRAAPGTLEELLRIAGLGAVRVERDGEAILGALREAEMKAREK